jgi:hypothetical protein
MARGSYSHHPLPPRAGKQTTEGRAYMRCRPLAPSVNNKDRSRSSSPVGSEDGSPELAIDGPWVFNEGLHLIQHQAAKCSVCDDFVQHYTAAVKDKELSLREACEARNSALGGAALLSADSLRTERDQALNEVAELRRRVAEDARKLKDALGALAAARGAYARMRAGGTHAPQPGPSSLSRKRQRTQRPVPLEEVTGDVVGVWIIDPPPPPRLEGECPRHLAASI